MNIITAKATMRRLGAELSSPEFKAMDVGRQKSTMSRIETEMKGAQDSITAYETSMRLMAGGTSLSGSHESYATGTKSYGSAPSLTPSTEQMRALHDAILSHKSIQLEVGLKDVSSLIPSQLAPGIVALPHEPTRIADLLPGATMAAPVIEYLRHVSTTGTAGTVAPGGLKPSVVMNVDKVEARAKKIAVTTTVNDEDLEDFSAFVGYVSAELTRLVTDKENQQILLGDGTGENLTGLLVVSGILTRVKGAAPETGIDTLELAAADMRTGPAFVEATLYAMHPTTWTTLRLLKDSQGRYLLGNPAEMDAAKLWGRPVIQSTAITVGTVAAINGPAAGAVYWRKGLTIQADYGQTGFEHNQTTLRCEERVALAIPKPAAVVKITGL